MDGDHDAASAVPTRPRQDRDVHAARECPRCATRDEALPVAMAHAYPAFGGRFDRLEQDMLVRLEDQADCA
jgi:hypothetical protein